MNNVFLCVGKYAKKPFYVKFSDFSLYSIEELCYYFIDKIYLLDEEIMSFELVEWIRTECGMEELADELDSFVRRHVSLAAFVTTILAKTGIYDENVVKKVDRILKEQVTLTPFERQKKRAEYYYQTGRFRQALLIYLDLLAETPKEETVKRSMLYYNIASIYAMDFHFEQAAEYYGEAYKLNAGRQTRQAFILANKKAMTDFDYGAFMREHEDWYEDFAAVEELCKNSEEAWQHSREKQLLDDMEKSKETGQMQIFYQKQGDLIRSLKEDYRRQTV